MNPRSFLYLALAAASSAFAVETTPVGYTTIECKANSDTIVGVPLRQTADLAGSLSASPNTTTIPGSAILSLAGTPNLSVNQYANTRYAKFKSGTANGQWFVVTANSAASLTVDLNGATLTAASGDQLEVIKFWTLAELFNPALSNTTAATTQNAIVASTSTNALGRRTSILIPDFTSTGINLAPSLTFIVHGGIWKQAGAGDADRGSYQLWPDSYFIIRHSNTVTASTFYTATGEVELGQFVTQLSVRASGGSQDNFVGLPRPIGIRLQDLNLAGTPAFMSSTSTNALGRRDQLLVFDNAATGINKAPTAYYFHSGIWKKAGDGDVDYSSYVIPQGAGFIVRKYFNGTGIFANWNNAPTY